MFPHQCQAIDTNREQCAYTTHAGAHTFELTAAEASAWQIMDGLPTGVQEQLTHMLTDQISDRAIDALHQLTDNRT